MALPMVGTIPLQRVWSRQHETEAGDAWVRGAWNATAGIQRDAILALLARLDPTPQSLLEVGCAAGANLRRIHAEYPDMRLTGVDGNGVALAYGTEAARAEGWGWCGIQQALPVLPVYPHDVVLSCYTLTYLDPGDIFGVLAVLWASARQALIIAEPGVEPGEDEQGLPGNQPDHDVAYQEWHYDYLTRLGMLPDPPGLISGCLLDPPRQRLRRVLMFQRGAAHCHSGCVYPPLV